MDIWLIKEGEKTGPWQDYLLREAIERGELSGDEMAWHDGREDWLPLRELDVFRANFEVSKEVTQVLPPPLPNKPRPFIRLWGRLFDLHLYLGFSFGLMRLLGLDMVEAISSSWFVLLYLLPWVVLEGIAIHLVGTTPGKWLLGIRVQKLGGGALELGASVRRAFRVYVFGMGLNLFLLREACQCFALWYTLKFKASWWDRIAGSEVRVEKNSPQRIVAFVFLFLGVLMTSGLIMKPLTDDVFKRVQEAYPGFIAPETEEEA